MSFELESDLQHFYQHTEALWPGLNGSNILVTGATGFVGSWLLESFLWVKKNLNLNARLYALTRDAQAFHARKPWLAHASGLEILVGDLKAFEFPRVRFDFVIHAAVEHENIEANLTGVRRIIDLARSQGITRLLFISSGAVYDPQPSEVDQLSETFATTGRPANLYAQIKRESEAMFLEAARAGLRVSIARLFTFAGPYLPLNKNFAIGNFVNDALHGGPIQILGDGTTVRSYLYAADLAIWLWTVMLRGESGSIFNVGSDQAVSILELARAVARVCNVTRGISDAQQAIHGGNVRRYVPSIQRARTELGLAPWISLDESIRRMYAWNQASIK